MDLWAVLGFILGNDQLQAPAAKVVGDFLKAKLPDATESAIAEFLVRVANQVSPSIALDPPPTV